MSRTFDATDLSRRTILALPLGFAAAASGARAAEPKRGGTMVMIVHPEPSTLAHYAVSAGNIPPIATQVYEGLCTYDWDQNPQPNLAKSWEVAPDGKTITFKLQEGVTFHNGKPFTSADVQYSFMEILKKYNPIAPVMLAELVAVDTPDPMTAVLRLANPAPYIMKALSGRDLPILCRSVFEGTDVLQNPSANKPIGTGPFKFASWERGQFVRLDRNETYWKPGLPYLNRIVARFIPDAATRSAAMETGEAHFAGYSAVNYADLARMKTNPILDLTTKGYEMTPAQSVLELNGRHPHLQKKEVRQAIAYAIDRKVILKDVMFGYGQPATGPLSRKFKTAGLYTDDVRQYDVPDRLDIANRLLDEAGAPRGADGTRFALHLEVNSFGEQWLRQAEYLKQALAGVGIAVTLRSEDTATWLRRVYTNYDYDLNEPFLSQGVDPVYGLNKQFLTSQIRKGVTFVNDTFYSNPEVDRMLGEGAREPDAEKRAALYKKVQQVLAEDSPMIWLIDVQYVSVFNRRLKDHTTGPLGTQQAFERAWMDK
ncbi:ABC transporter substrate-binding protein [Methylobacterium radiotolerans]|uniref:ABC transporter substrate-binding protein n=1 Tax=Methylobacterium radiotolerans TaxID=31998 RepID=UPI000D5E15A2|nr:MULTISPECIES: ABC transporter substrate-binding protein [Methylobacterium]MDE3749932.1 ABC transporter substrate-binding protein [Methylobacterium radiotolerans]PVY88521.1 peptide/nickel transport system substrate-binding protein [Methylobacterium organophilum]